MQQPSGDNIISELENARAQLRDLSEATRELNKTKERLAESEERYRTAFEYTGTAMIVIDNDLSMTMANHKLEEITGYDQEEILKKRKWTEFIAPEDIPRMMEYHQKRRTAPESVPNTYEFRLVDRNGTIRDMLLSAAMIPGSAKSLVSVVDISPLKQTERALRESERRYRELFENATDLIYTTDLDGNFTSANLSALTTFGYSREEMAQTNIRQLIDPAYIAIVNEKLTERLSLAVPEDRYELLARTRDGKPVWIELSARIIRDADCSVGIQGIARDITERKLHETQLHESQERFKETAYLLPGIICEIDLSMKLTYVNELGLTSFGFTNEDFERGLGVFDLVPEHDRARFLQDIHNVTHGDYGNPKLYELCRSDGKRLQLIINSAPIIRSGEIVGIRSCLIDISDRVRAEKEIHESEERFRSIFACSPIGIALYDTNGKLLEKNDSFGRIFGAAGETFHKASLFDASAIDDEQRRNLDGGIHVTLETALDDLQSSASKHWFEWNISAIGQPGAPPSMYLAQVRDITDRKVADEAKLQKEREATARAEAMVAGLRKELREYTGFNNIVSRSPDMKQIFDILPEVAQASATALICGDSGTGKELIARSLHELSDRKEKPFVAINCSALPDNLLESELFGYKAGAFTDAKKDKPGRFALAEGGTIFLDEIGDISPAMQVKLLRVLQERMYEPLGATQPQKANVRVIAATNKNLAEMVNLGNFREDLFYRINVITIQLPALKERRCDIPLLCDHFIERFNQRYDKKIKGLAEEALKMLLAHDFPGNIRELENIIEHAFIFCKSDTIGTLHLPATFRQRSGDSETAIFAGIKNFDELERMYLKSVLAECGNSKVAACERLGIHKATLFRKLKQLGLQ